MERYRGVTARLFFGSSFLRSIPEAIMDLFELTRALVDSSRVPQRS